MRKLSACLVAAAAVSALCAWGPQAAAQAAGEPPGFVPGEASAVANTVVLGLSPGGGKPIDVSLGASKARYQNRTATSEGAALGLGLLQIFLGPTSQCGPPDHAPIIPASQLPPVTTGDSRHGTTMAAPLDVRSPGDANGPGGVIGNQIANAQPDPQSSSAATSTVAQDFGVLALDGGHTEASTELSGGVRQAVAVTTGTQLRILGGLITIDQPRWEARATSGATETATGSFTFASASIFGIPRAAPQFASDFGDFANGLANLLGFLGVHLTYPTVTIDAGRVDVSPLVLGLANPPIGLDFIKPLLTALGPMKEQNAAAEIAQDCNNQAVLQIVDLVLGVLSGTGSVDLNVGGATAFTAATEFPDAADIAVPPLDLTPPPASVQSFEVAQPVVTTTEAPPVTLPVLAAPAVTVPVVETPTVTTIKPKPQPAPVFDLPTAAIVQSRFLNGKHHSSAIYVGAAGLVLLLLIGAGDRFVMRRARKKGAAA